jgi:hypothetical protein
MKRVAVLACILLLAAASSAWSQQIQDVFYVTIGPDGGVVQGGGSGFEDGYWYVYPSGWINEWFYDHPFDPTRGKIIHIEFEWQSFMPDQPTYIGVAINWSTPEWSELGYGPNMPPTPEFDENLYIIRGCLMSEVGTFPTANFFARDFIIWPYNPEWVSIDVRGYNFEIINGVIIHECTIGAEESTWGGIKSLFR